MGDIADQVADDAATWGTPEDLAEFARETAAWEEQMGQDKTAQELADERQSYAVHLKRRTEGHQSCPGAPRFDPELGVVCYCGEVLELPDGPPPTTQPLPPSETTRAAAAAVPVIVEPVDKQVTASSGIASAVHPQDPILARIDVIDPTAPYDAKMVEEHILDANARLERGAHYERVCAEDYYDKTMAYERARARALLQAHKEVGGAADIRGAWADVAVEAEYMDKMIAKMKLDAIKSTMHSLRAAISAYQSVAKSIATSYGTYSQSKNYNQNPF